MRAFTAALLAASAAAATTYTLAGNKPTGITSSKATAVVTLTGTTLTIKLTTDVVIAAAMAANGVSDSILCFKAAANDYRCMYGAVAFTSASNYTATWMTYKWTTTAATLANATTKLTALGNLTADTGTAQAQAATAWGSAVSSPVKTSAVNSAWAINSITAVTAKTGYTFAGTYTISSSNATAEGVVKTGMATAYQGVGHFISTQATAFTTLALATGASQVLAAGAAIAALAMSF